MQRFRHVDEHCRVAPLHCLVQQTHIARLDDPVEAQRLREGRKHLGLLHRTRRLLRILRVRTKKQHPVVVRLKPEYTQMTRGGHQRAEI